MDLGGCEMNSLFNKTMNTNRIPTEEEIAQADKLMRERYRGLSDVTHNLKERFREEGLHEAATFYSEDSGFGICLFYRRQKDILKAEKSGLTARIKTAAEEELEKGESE